eukprot:CAMPEP_0116837616 /NCGR_PEP_ID=MMETSP0418-20121206/8748_1 /TAXON_ID=1158023 /ORGANISM="Astrosyne radiata, Strain 13vi08-1A" /LENGTH=152 /DNA_ID=CAMNT_0004467511 /DNA_START=17 /DNA_END=475 /DNA_ORIENTATION=+
MTDPPPFFSNQRRSVLKETFDYFDSDKNGSISQVELQKSLRKLLGGQEFSEEEMDYIMSVVFDENLRNGVTFEDFVESLQRDEFEYDDADEELRKVFDSFDSDSNGLLSQEELRAGLERLGISLSEEEWASLERAMGSEIGFEQFKEFVENC